MATDMVGMVTEMAITAVVICMVTDMVTDCTAITTPTMVWQEEWVGTHYTVLQTNPLSSGVQWSLDLNPPCETA